MERGGEELRREIGEVLGEGGVAFRDEGGY